MKIIFLFYRRILFAFWVLFHLCWQRWTHSLQGSQVKKSLLTQTRTLPNRERCTGDPNVMIA
ncbi:unnamed protein product [Clavelina lepadiformis]|uniref:Secreted protein n=1 Tax=Clavelina lepadiformis TaxID=159417 RepID=A0ABP0F5J7_CLALP